MGNDDRAYRLERHGFVDNDLAGVFRRVNRKDFVVKGIKDWASENTPLRLG